MLKKERILRFARVTIVILLALVAFMAFARGFRAATWVFLILWVLVPCAAWVAGTTKESPISTEQGLRFVRASLLTVAIAISLLVWADYERLRDAFGKAFVQGYFVTYSVEEDDDGRLRRKSKPHASNWYAEYALRMSEFAAYILYFGMPWMTWRGITSELERRERERSIREVESAREVENNGNFHEDDDESEDYNSEGDADGKFGEDDT